MAPQPSVSVVIPSYNRGHCIADTLRSVLAQTLAPSEVIVVDDGSSDDTPAVLAGFGPPVRYVRKPNGGVSSARNEGIRQAQGDFIALLDADDLWPTSKLAIQIAVHEALPHVGWSITNHITTDLPGNVLPGRQGFERDFGAFAAAGLGVEAFFQRAMQKTEVAVSGSRYNVFSGDAYLLLFDGNFVFPSCAVVRRDVALRAGPWDETFRVANDTEWFHRIAAVAPAAVVMAPLMFWRRGQSNTLMQPRHGSLLIRNAITSLDRAVYLRGEPDAALRALHAASRNRLLHRLAWFHLTECDGRSVRAALSEAAASGRPRTFGSRMLQLASYAPAPVLRLAGAAKRRLSSVKASLRPAATGAAEPQARESGHVS